MSGPPEPHQPQHAPDAHARGDAFVLSEDARRSLETDRRKAEARVADVRRTVRRWHLAQGVTAVLCIAFLWAADRADAVLWGVLGSAAVIGAAALIAMVSDRVGAALATQATAASDLDRVGAALEGRRSSLTSAELAAPRRRAAFAGTILLLAVTAATTETVPVGGVEISSQPLAAVVGVVLWLAICGALSIAGLKLLDLRRGVRRDLPTPLKSERRAYPAGADEPLDPLSGPLSPVLSAAAVLVFVMSLGSVAFVESNPKRIAALGLVFVTMGGAGVLVRLLGLAEVRAFDVRVSRATWFRLARGAATWWVFWGVRVFYAAGVVVTAIAGALTAHLLVGAAVGPDDDSRLTAALGTGLLTAAGAAYMAALGSVVYSWTRERREQAQGADVEVTVGHLLDAAAERPEISARAFLVAGAYALVGNLLQWLGFVLE